MKSLILVLALTFLVLIGCGDTTRSTWHDQVLLELINHFNHS